MRGACMVASNCRVEWSAGQLGSPFDRTVTPSPPACLLLSPRPPPPSPVAPLRYDEWNMHSTIWNYSNISVSLLLPGHPKNTPVQFSEVVLTRVERAGVSVSVWGRAGLG